MALVKINISIIEKSTHVKLWMIEFDVFVNINLSQSDHFKSEPLYHF